jgi:carboxyl-terminal processing protease
MSYILRILLVAVICGRLVSPVQAVEPPLKPAASEKLLSPDTPKATNGAPLAPGPNDWRIAYTTVLMLEKYHYLRMPFDSHVSGKFFDLYLNTLDPQHIHFLQSDVAEFAQNRTNLNQLIKRQHDTTLAYTIFNRFLQRLEQRSEFSKELLKGGPLDFTGNEKVSLNRKLSPFPKDLAEAQTLWRERVRYEYLQEKLNKESEREIAAIALTHHDPISVALTGHDFHSSIVKIITLRYNRTLRNFKEWDSEKVLEYYLSALAHVYDPHSDYEDREDLENFSIQMSLSLFGIGAVLTTTEDGMYCQIKELNPSGPAAKSKKFKPNDRIVAVAQGTNEPVDVVDMPLNKTVDLIRGPKGTEVRLTVIPADAIDPSTHVTISLIRDEIKLEEQQAKAKLVEIPGKDGKPRRLGIINLPSFYASFRLIGSKPTTDKSATVDVARLLEKLNEEKVTGIILDLRRNGGGSLEEAINMTGLFIKEGPVVQVKGPEADDIRVDEDHDPSVQYDGPLIVLTDRFSASASEILAGALQDYGRALVVGDASTHGKGTVQSMTQLAPYIFFNAGLDPANYDPRSFGALRYTTNKFYRVSGSSTQLKGVVPDIILPSIGDYLEVGEVSLENPLAWDEIKPAEYEKLNRVKPYLTELEKRSNSRVAAAKDFDYVREDIELVKKAVAEKIVSLNEQQRLKEKSEQEARAKSRERELKARKLPVEKVYDLTIKGEEVLMKEATNAQFAANTPANGAFPHGEPAHHPVGYTTKLPDHKIESATNSPTKSNNVSLVNSDEATLKSADSDDEAPEDKVPQVDADLKESESILFDYISLSQAASPLTVEQKN